MYTPLKTKTPAVAGPGLSEKTELVCNSFLAVPRRFVNFPGLFFRVRPLAGLLTSGVWCDRLALWIPLLDQAARLLRDTIGGRI